MSAISVTKNLQAKFLTLGTMRMLEIERTDTEWLKFLRAAYDFGVTTLHSSNEYDSFPLLSSLLGNPALKDNGEHFRHIVKLAEPSFGDLGFDAQRVRQKVLFYAKYLSAPIIQDIQWMWRLDLSNDQQRISDFEAVIDSIGETVLGLKRDGLIERFFCFPYSIDFGRAALTHEMIDGLVVYRNVQETEYDLLIQQCNRVGKKCQIIRPFNAGLALSGDGRTPSELLKFSLSLPAIESAIVSSNNLDHLKQLAAVVRERE